MLVKVILFQSSRRAQSKENNRPYHFNDSRSFTLGKSNKVSYIFEFSLKVGENKKNISNALNFTKNRFVKCKLTK